MVKTDDNLDAKMLLTSVDTENVRKLLDICTTQKIFLSVDDNTAYRRVIVGSVQSFLESTTHMITAYQSKQWQHSQLHCMQYVLMNFLIVFALSSMSTSLPLYPAAILMMFENESPKLSKQK